LRMAEGQLFKLGVASIAVIGSNASKGIRQGVRFEQVRNAPPRSSGLMLCHAGLWR
jgi:hypothetical protein